MLRILTLRGKVNGSAIINTTAGRTSLELRSRDGSAFRNPAAVFFIADSGLCEATFSEPRWTADIGGTKGVLLVGSGGEVIASGSSGLSEKALDSAITAVRLLAAERKNRPQQRMAQKPETERQVFAVISGTAVQTGPASTVTQSIIDAAKALFEGKSAPPEQIAGVEYPLENERQRMLKSAGHANRAYNPFPHTFPDAVWERTDDPSVLRGRATVRGCMHELTAVPCGVRRYARRTSDFRIRGNDGIVYRIRLGETLR